MARPRKCRRVCHFPLSQGFVPTDGDTPGPEIVLTVDEYEALRLIDREGLSQEECGLRMDVARTTVQQIYAQARKKLADMLVEMFCCATVPPVPACAAAAFETHFGILQQKEIIL